MIDFFSLNDRYKVSISKGNDGNYRVTTYEWTHFEGYSDEWLHYWEEIYGPSITDNEETAKSIAIDEIKRLTGEIAFKTDWIEPEKPEKHG